MTRQTPGALACPRVLDDITATVEGLCACGCGAELDPQGASGYFARESCQRRWSARAVGAEVDPDDELIVLVERALAGGEPGMITIQYPREEYWVATIHTVLAEVYPLAA
jgi:hypothetical protein